MTPTPRPAADAASNTGPTRPTPRPEGATGDTAPGRSGVPDTPAGATVGAARAEAARAPVPAWPLALGLLALAVHLGVSTVAAWRDAQRLQAAVALQQTTVDAALRLRGALDALASDTRALADGGHANARALVEAMQRRGVTLQAAPPAGAAGVPAAPRSP